jgi:hypothetical protein
VTTKQLAPPVFKAPFHADFNGGYVFDAEGRMFAQIRGWGRMQYQPGAEETQDANLRWLVEALNEKAERGDG